MTYSIVARDPRTGQLGIGVQSHHFGVGAIVPFLHSDAGAIAVQSFAGPEYGINGLQLLREGRDCGDVLARLLADDPGRSRAQVTVMSTTGEVATFTGSNCVGLAGHITDNALSCQANMVESDAWSAMHDAFRETDGDLPKRLIAALCAAEEGGGDRRGQQSAAVVVTSRRVRGALDVDLRVDDHDEPLAELTRLDRMRRSSAGIHSALGAARHGRLAEALDDLTEAQAGYGEANLEPSVWAAVLLARAGRLSEARALVRRAMAVHDGWKGFLASLPDAGLLPEDPELLRGLLADPEAVSR